MKIELSDETVSQLVVRDLKDAYELCRVYDDKVTMEALSRVLKHYMIASEYDTWHKENVRKKQ